MRGQYPWAAIEEDDPRAAADGCAMRDQDPYAYLLDPKRAARIRHERRAQDEVIGSLLDVGQACVWIPPTLR
jgi:hypothetical protein